MNYRDEKEQIQALAPLIAVQLNALFPDGFSLEDPDQCHKIQQCFRKLLPKVHGTGETVTTNGPVYLPEYWKKVFPIAIQQWKELQTQENRTGAYGTKSFSLLDQWNSNTFSLPTFQLDEVLKSPTIPARLKLLQQIQYLEDIIVDWKGVKELLQSGLQYDTVTTKEEGSTQEEFPGSVAREYLQLHRKWFHEARSSNEYLGIQYDLCSNLSHCITSANILRPRENDSSWLFDLLQNWQDMVLDIMQRDQYVAAIEEETKAIESTFFLILESKQTDSRNEEKSAHGSSSSYATPAQMLAIIDPQAHCFASWIHHVPLSSLVSMLEQRSSLLSLLWQRCQRPETTRTPCSEESSSSSSSMMSMLRWYSISALTFLWIKLRVALFPWNLLVVQVDVQPTTTTMKRQDDNTSANLIHIRHQVLELLVETAMSLSTDSTDQQPWRQQTCCDAIETILFGLDAATRLHIKTMLARLETKLPNHTGVIWNRLHDIVTEVERHC